MKSILLVDDDPSLLVALERMLLSQSDSWEVTTASNGLEALRLVRAASIDLLITDLFMPDQDGLGIISSIRSSYPTVKIIAMTAGGNHVQTNFLPIARALGANAVLEKPFLMETFIGTVRSLLFLGDSDGLTLPRTDSQSNPVTVREDLPGQWRDQLARLGNQRNFE